MTPCCVAVGSGWGLSASRYRCPSLEPFASAGGSAHGPLTTCALPLPPWPIPTSLLPLPSLGRLCQRSPWTFPVSLLRVWLGAGGLGAAGGGEGGPQWLAWPLNRCSHNEWAWTYRRYHFYALVRDWGGGPSALARNCRQLTEPWGWRQAGAVYPILQHWGGGGGGGTTRLD